MFVDACALIALATKKPEAISVSNALTNSKTRLTSPVAVLETVIALSRPDKFDCTPTQAEAFLMDLLDSRNIKLVDLPVGKSAASLSIGAIEKYGKGARRLNLGDCLHYACAKYYRVPILATHDEFRQTDLETVP
ncbi:type II toxin-antitoxin system VapC family toxin [Ochrobactrum sp. BTU1]|uniref:type II toxin-antitoxin system VapC family toxin n=1 Tax=Ochrobactrum sp. BTU1 TaxID=2840456 RepID=UPI001C0504DB|nr:type II toxin-antitoxin system VapC family toxin [Ochrobactrum sp. BTU1]